MTTTDTRTPCLVIICGEIDIATTGNLRDALTTALTRGPHIEADLSAVTFMDASGIGVLLAVAKQAMDAGGTLTLRAPSRTVRRLVEILGLDEVLPVAGRLATGRILSSGLADQVPIMLGKKTKVVQQLQFVVTE